MGEIPVEFEVATEEGRVILWAYICLSCATIFAVEEKRITDHDPHCPSCLSEDTTILVEYT